MKHENIVELYDYTENDKEIVLLMEYCNDANYFEQKLEEVILKFLYLKKLKRFSDRMHIWIDSCIIGSRLTSRFTTFFLFKFYFWSKITINLFIEVDTHLQLRETLKICLRHIIRTFLHSWLGSGS
jgi:serine/threonine protein kinase